MSIVSVVVPTAGRPEALRRCLASLAAQTYPRDAFEVVVVDAGGAPPVEPPLPEALASQLALRLLRVAPVSLAEARAQGIAVARGDPLVLLDDDCTVPAEYLARVDLLFRMHPDVAAVQARVENGEPGSLYGRTWAYAHRVALRATTERRADGRILAHALGGPPVLRRAALRAAAFDPDAAGGLGEAELRLRLRRAGVPVYHEPALVVRRHGQATLGGHLAQHFDQGRAEARLRRTWGRPAGRMLRRSGLTSIRALLTEEGIRRGLAMRALLWLGSRARVGGLLFERDLALQPDASIARRTARVTGQWLAWESRWVRTRLRRALTRSGWLPRPAPPGPAASAAPPAD